MTTYGDIPSGVSPSAMQVCQDCGAVVFMPGVHAAWHAAMLERVDAAPDKNPIVFDAWNRPGHAFTGKRQYGFEPKPHHECARCGIRRDKHE